MRNSVANYLFSITVLGLACVIYQCTFVPWIEPDPLPGIVMAGSPVLRNDTGLESLFAADSWQLGNCKRLQTRDGVLLFENWRQMSEDQWKLWPVTVVIGMDSDSPLVLESQEGAEIKFTQSLDVMSGGAPPIERGRLVGAVKIRNAPPRVSATRSNVEIKKLRSRQINLQAFEVGIDHRKVWTTQPFRLQLGDAVLVGRDLTLHLATAGGLIAANENAMSVLDHLELIYLDELTVPLEPGGLWGEQATNNTIATPLAERPKSIGQRTLAGAAAPQAVTSQVPSPGLASLRCGGRVVFQFATGELTLQDRVELLHQASIASPVVDTFQCDTLRLRFADLTAKRQRGDKLQNYLLSLTATGRPAQAELPTFQANLAAEQIEFDVRAGKLRMGGHSGVQVSYAGSRWQFDQVNYLINQADPKSIGTFDAIGAGSMEVASHLAIPIERVTWSNGVKLQRGDQPGEMSLGVDGELRATMTDGGSFRCDTALVVLQQIDDGVAKTRLLPKRLQASGQVNLDTPVIAVATRLLQIYFEVAAAGPGPPTTDALAATNPNSISSSSASLRSWIKQPQDDPASAALASKSTPIARPRPSIHGDAINAKLSLSDGDVTARDLLVAGNVSLRHEIQTKSGPLDAVLTGERLILRDGGVSDILQIESGLDRPARFTLGDGYFIGPRIQVRLADNVVWINDAGEFQMPTQVLPSLSSMAVQTQMTSIIDDPSPSTATAIQWVSPPRCRWNGEMEFDGRSAQLTLTDGIEISATMVAGAQREVWDLRLAGDQLRLLLAGQVNVGDVESMRAATIDHIKITSSAAHPLLVTANQLTTEGMRKARHVLAAPELIMHPQQGMLRGPGPGWYRAWLDTDPVPKFGQMALGQERVLASMVGVHLVYQETLDADLNNQVLSFVRGVRIASKAVTSWDDVIDVSQMQGLRLGESTLDCDQLRLAIDKSRSWMPSTSPTSAPWELESRGSIVFQTRNDKGLFNGTADRAAFTAAKDLFVIEGSPGRSAVMNQTLPTGQPGMNWVFERLVGNTRTMDIENIEHGSFQLGTLPTPRKQ